MRTVGWHPQSQIAELSTGKIHYVDTGKEDGPVLLLLHGYIMSSWAWRLNIEALGITHRVIAMCHQGFGFSDKPRADYRLESLGSVVLSLLDHLDIQECDVVGHSMGGAIALGLSSRAPSRFRRLVLVCSAGLPWRLPRVLTALPLPILVSLSGALFKRQVMKRILDLLGYEKPVVNEVYMDTYMRALRSPGFAFAAMKTAEEFSSGLDRLRTVIPHVPHKTLLIWGALDKIVPLRAGKILEGKMPNARLEIFEDCGHCPNEEDAERFNRAVLEFVGEV